MNRHIFRLTLALIALILNARLVDASILDWLDKMSGPGPFWGIDVSVGVKCFGFPKPTNNQTPAGEALSSGGIILGCVTRAPLDERHFTWLVSAGGAIASDNPLNYGDSGKSKSRAVRLLRFGSSLDYTVHPALDIGAGAGLIYFAGPSFDNFALPYVEPLRFTSRPLLLVSRHPKPDQVERWGWLLVSANWNIVVGTVDGAKFGAPLDPFKARSERGRWRYGVGIDFMRLGRALK